MTESQAMARLDRRLRELQEEFAAAPPSNLAPAGSLVEKFQQLQARLKTLEKQLHPRAESPSGNSTLQ
jgi:uncharacterized coiled-coil protein SlyX